MAVSSNPIGNVPINTLPEHILISEVLSKLTVPDLLISCQINNRVSSLCREDQFWETLSRINYPELFYSTLEIVPNLKPTWRDFYLNIVRHPLDESDISVTSVTQGPSIQSSIIQRPDLQDRPDVINRIQRELRLRSVRNRTDEIQAYHYDQERHGGTFGQIFLVHSVEEAILKVDYYYWELIKDELKYIYNERDLPPFAKIGPDGYYFIDDITTLIVEYLTGDDTPYWVEPYEIVT